MFLFRTCVCCSFHYSLIFYASFSSSPRFCVSTFPCCFFIRLLFCYRQAAHPTAVAAAAVVVYVCVSAVSVCLGWCPVMCTTGIFCCCVVLHVVARARLYFLLPFFLSAAPLQALPFVCSFIPSFFLILDEPGWGQPRVISVFVYYRAKVISFSTHTHICRSVDLFLDDT